MSTAAEVRAALAYVPAHDRDTWLRIGMAIKSELGEDGFDPWDEWSQQDESYNAADARDVWRSIRADGKVTLGTLYHEAKRHGFQPAANDKPKSSAKRERVNGARHHHDDDGEARRRAKAATTAAGILQALLPVPDDHAYLKRKGIKAHGAKLYRGDLVIRDMACDGALAFPLRDLEGTLHSLQFVAPTGDKRFLAGGRKNRCYFAIGKPETVVCVAEGFATGASIHEATGHAVAIAFDAGNLEPVAQAMRAKFPDLRLILCGDDDETGRAKATAAARAVGGLVAIPVFGDERPEGTKDFNDLARLHGAEAVKHAIASAIVPEVPESQPRTSSTTGTDSVSAKAPDKDEGPTPLPYVWASSVSDAHAPNEIVETTLVARAMSVIYGESGSGKTFIALDLGCRQALGWPWLGRRTRRGLVVYAAAEAGATIHNRVKAFKDRHDVEDLPVALVVCPINLLDPAADVGRLIAMIHQIELEQDEPVVLVIVDTLSRAMAGGDENSPEAMGALVRNSDRIRDQTEAHVLWVHHAGKDLTRGARGHSLLRAAVDTELECTSDGETIRIRVTKQRDGPGGVEFAAKLLPVPVGTNSWGDPITSCIVEYVPGNDGPQRGRERKPPKGTAIALQALREALSKHGESMPGSSVTPAGVRAVTGEIWRRRYETLDPLDPVDGSAESAKRAGSARRRRFERARNGLLEAGIVAGRSDSWWLV